MTALVASLLMLSDRRARLPGCLIFGASAFLLAGQTIIEGRLDSRYVGDSLLTDVRILDFPKQAAGATLMTVEPIDDPRLPSRSRISWFAPGVQPAIGDVWRLELRLKRPRGLSNPGVFDRESWLFRNAIQASGYVVTGRRNQRLATGTASPIDTFRQDFVARSAAAADSDEAAAVLAAIGVGARHRVQRAQWERYAITGTSHLMAISGLHIGLAAGAGFLLLRVLISALPLVANAHLTSLLGGAIGAGAYALVSGTGIPAQRSIVMLSLAAAAVWRRRRIAAAETLAFAATVVYVVNPIATMAPGFHLSFSAVLVLLWLAANQQCRTRARSVLASAASRLQQLATMQTCLLFGLMPLTVALFQRIALLALPVNLVAVPVFSVFTVPCTLFGLAVGRHWDSASNLALRLAASSVDLLESALSGMATVPLADISVVRPDGPGWLIAVLPALLVILPKGWPGRYVAILAVVALLLPPTSRPPDSCVDTTVLDTGQGLATIMRTASRTLVFDTGASFRGGGSIAGQVIVPFMKARGLQHIDWLLISHADIDHSGGVRDLLRYASVGALLAGEPLPNSGPDATPCVAGQRWTADGIRFQILHPPATALRDGNDSSCVLLVESGGHSVLLTGDIEAAAERQIARWQIRNTVDAVLVPHHGSSTSSSAEFVAATAPQLAIVSSGFGNRWGFPRPEVTARWQAAGARVVNTASAGAVSFRLCAAGGIADLTLEREKRRRFWRRDP